MLNKNKTVHFYHELNRSEHVKILNVKKVWGSKHLRKKKFQNTTFCALRKVTKQ